MDFSQPFITISASIAIFFIYKKIIAKDDSKKAISDTLWYTLLITSVFFIINKKEGGITDSFRAKTNF